MTKKLVIQAQGMTREEILALNANRQPRDRVGEKAVCGGKTRTANARNPTCTNLAGQGTDHEGVGYCKFHGGNTESGVKSAAKTLGRALIQDEKDLIVTQSLQERFGGDPSSIRVTPEEALLEEVRRSVAMVRWLEEKIGNWSVQDDSGNPVDPATLPPDFDPSEYRLGGLPALMEPTKAGGSAFTSEREWLLLYREERLHAVKVAKRMVTIAEDQGRMLATAIRAVLDALALSPSQVALVPQVVPGVLRSVTQGIALPSALPLSPPPASNDD